MKRAWSATRTLLSAISLGAALLVIGCGAKQAADPPGQGSPNSPAQRSGGQQRPGGRAFAAIPVQAIAVTTGVLSSSNSTAGTVVPVTQSSVASQVAGVVSRVVHNAGDWVKEGQTVVQLDDSQLQLAVQAAQAAVQNAKVAYDIGQYNVEQSDPKLQLQVQSAQSALASAQKNYDSQKALYNIGGISASQLDTASSQLQQAQANLEAAKTALDQNAKSSTQTLAQLKLAIDQSQVQVQIAQLNLQNASIRAPFAGQIAEVQVNPGTYVSLNTAVFVLVSPDCEIDFNVPPTDAPTLATGTPVTFSYQGKDYKVKVSQAPSAPINGVVPMVAALPRALKLPYGGVGTVSYSLSLAQGAIVPIGALQVNEDQNYVYAIADGKAVVKTVTILAESGTSAAVAGVNAGDMVIVNPPAGLLAGSTVQAVGGTGAGQGAGGAQGTVGSQQTGTPRPVQGGSR